MIHIPLDEDDFRMLVAGGVVEKVAQGNIVSGPTKVQISLSEIGFFRMCEIVVDGLGSRPDSFSDDEPAKPRHRACLLADGHAGRCEPES